MSILIEVWGDNALFTRPETKAERMSYQVITPSAARGIIEAVLWKPEIKWFVDGITVINEIKFTNIRRNEVSEKVSHSNMLTLMNGGDGKTFLSASEYRQQRASTVLKDVRYLLEVRFELTDKGRERNTDEKYYNMVLRRIRNGQCFHQPYFGCREFPVFFRLVEGDKPKSFYEGTTIDLGQMLWDMDFSGKDEIKPIFFHAVMKDGVIDTKRPGVIN